MSQFQWQCPACTHVNNDDIDAELGPFVTVTCSACNQVFDDSALQPAEVDAWDLAIDLAKQTVVPE